MGLRETLEKKKGLSTGLAVGLIVVAVGLIAWQLLSMGGNTLDAVPDEFFTVDDGQTYFTAKASNVPPFDHKGKEAVKAVVYECDGKKFVAYLQRYTPQARLVMLGNSTSAQKPGAGKAPAAQSPEAIARAALPPPSPGLMRDATMNGVEVKRPGEKEWTRSTNRQKASEIQTVKCPGGGPGTPKPVFP